MMTKTIRNSPAILLGCPIAWVGMTLMLGTGGLPHVLIRFFTVANAKEARKSVGWTTTC